MLKKIIPGSILLIFLLMSGCGRSPRVLGSLLPPTDSSMLAEKYDVAELEKKYPHQSFIVKKLGLAFDFTTEGIGAMHTVDFERYVILDTGDPDASYVGFTMKKPCKVAAIYAVAKSPSGKIQRFGSNDFTLQEIDDVNKTYKLVIPATEKGTLIEQGVDYMIYQTPENFKSDFDINLLQKHPVENLEMNFLFPKSWNVMAKKRAAGEKPYLTDTIIYQRNKQVYTYKGSDYPQYKKEIYSPDYRSIHPYIQLQFDRINSYYSTSLFNWRDFSKYFRKYILDNDKFFSTAVGNKAKELVNGETDPIIKMKKIVGFIQNNIKIADDKVTRDFPEILEAKKGDPFEICGLTHYMLKKAGLLTDYLLIHSATGGYLDQQYISYKQFRIPAVRVFTNGKYYVMFPFMKYVPVGLVPETYAGETALLISNDDDLCGTQWKIPTEENSTDSTADIVTLKIASDGNISVEDRKIFHGIPAFTKRAVYSNMNKNELDKAIRLEFISPDIKTSNFQFELKNLENIDEDFTIIAKYTVDNLVTITPEEVVFQTGGLLSPVNLYSQKIDTTERVNPIEVDGNYIFRKLISVSYPPEWVPQTELRDTVVTNKFGTSFTKIKSSGSTLDVIQHTSIKKSNGSKNEIALLYDIIMGDQRRNIPTLIYNIGK
jgi:hypothetical protein